MSKIELIQGDCLEKMKDIPSGSIDLVLVDPPYFRVVNHKWDKFKNIEEYREFSQKYIKQLNRILRFNGTVLLFGCSVNVNILSLLNSMMEDGGGFEFIQEIIIDKGMKSIAGRISRKIKMLPPVSENIFVYRKDAKPFVKDLLKTHQQKLGMSTEAIKKLLGMAINGGGNWTKYAGDTEFPLFPTEEFWNKIRSLFSIDMKYEAIKETYNGIVGLTNVWNDIRFYVKPRLHPTQKPLDLINRCISIFSNENNNVLDNFMGSGTTGVACKNLNRNFIGIELDPEYFKIAEKQINENL